MSYDIVQEKVPDFIKRIGDQVIHGSNNTIIILGTDRAKDGPAKISDGLGTINASGEGKGTGTIHIIAGRQDETGNPDLKNDSTYLYLTMKSKIDTNVGLTSIEKSSNDLPGAILKTDAIRFVYRKNLKMCIDDGKNYIYMDDGKITISVKNSKTKIELDGSKIKIDSPKVHLTGGCQDPWDKLFSKIVAMVEGHDHATGTGPSGPGKAGPSSVSLDAELTAAKQGWDSEVKS
ncbi:MAG: hypothetical protein WC895_04290 [Candidatus Shapirobacteria bacterium]|jgi:hypothetical protein